MGRIAQVARGESIDGLAAETHHDIKVQAAKHGNDNYGCPPFTVMIWRHMYDSTDAAQKQKSKLKFVTLDKKK